MFAIFLSQAPCWLTFCTCNFFYYFLVKLFIVFCLILDKLFMVIFVLNCKILILTINVLSE